MTQPPRQDRQIARALFCTFTVLYLLMFGGHTYAPDEEMLDYVTQGIVERGSTAIARRWPTGWRAFWARRS